MPKQIHLTISENLNRGLMHLAAVNEQTKTAIVRQALREYLKAHGLVPLPARLNGGTPRDDRALRPKSASAGRR